MATLPSTLRLGTGKAVITPPLGVRMSGYGFRTKGADEVLDELEARVFWFEVGEGAPGDGSTARRGAAGTGPLCIVTADVIAFDTGLTHRLRALFAERLGVAPEAVLLAASHTHSGPQTCENMELVGGPPDPYYMERFTNKLLQAAADARKSARPVAVAVGRGVLSGYAINRRVIENGTVRMAPNPEGIRDDDVTVLLFRDAETKAPAGLLFHYTCHPTIMGSYAFSADYPGAARRHVENALGGAACGYLPGCFGDVRPNCTLIGGKEFRRGTPQDVRAFGTALGTEVLRAAKEAREIESEPRLFARTAEVRLPLAAEPEHATLTLQRLDLAPTVRLVALGGEICVGYGHFIKGLDAAALTVPVGYSNGMVGYVPTAEILAQGGYEAVGSCPYFGLPSPFKPEIEGLIQEGIRGLFKDSVPA